MKNETEREPEKKRWLPYLVYALLSLAILGPLLRPGYVLVLDALFTPRMDFSAQLYGLFETISARAPLQFLIQLLTAVVPGWLLQKFIFWLVFFLAGLGMHKLVPSGGISRYFAGLLYAVNPFTY